MLGSKASLQSQDAGLEARVSASLQSQDAGLEACVSAELDAPFQYRNNAKTQGSRPASSIISMAKRRAQARVSAANEPCVSVITTPITGSSTTHVMREVNLHYGGFLVEGFTPETPINS